MKKLDGTHDLTLKSEIAANRVDVEEGEEEAEVTITHIPITLLISMLAVLGSDEGALE